MKTSHNSYLRRNALTLEARLRYRISMMKAHARVRGISWNLTDDYIIQLWRKQSGRCAYSGKRMYLAVGRGWSWRNHCLSIDRVDNKKPYEPGNVVLCRYSENNHKNRQNIFSAEYMETYPERIANLLSILPELNAVAA